MKRIAAVWLSGTILLLLTVAFAGAQTLGDYAREARKEKAQKAPAAKHFDNDNLPKTEHLSVVGQAEAKPADTGSTDSEAKPDESAQSADVKQPKPKKDDAASDKDDAVQEWKKKITDQKDQIDLLSRELDVMDREYRMRAAAFYADAGNRLRNQADWDKQDAQYKQQIADKQKALDDAKQKLEDMQERARKAGVPSAQRE